MKPLEKWNKNTALALNNDKLTIKSCLEAPHISTLVSEYGFKAVAERITKELESINVLYGFKVNEAYYLLFVEFIIQTYKFESMNDIVMCLTNGKNGKYGKPFSQLDPATFQNTWMSQHLEQKAIARERKLIEHKKEFKGKNDFKDKNDYTKFVLQGLENQKRIDISKKELSKREADYRKFKAEYEVKNHFKCTESK